MGATVIVSGRDGARIEALVRQMRAGGGDAHGIVADLSSLAAVRGLAAETLDRFQRLHVLINNAGLVHRDRILTADGFEETFQVNHLAPFLLTSLLVARLQASAPARIVNVASGAHKAARLDLDDLQLARRYNGLLAYANSKLANVLFTYELAKRLAGTGVTVNAVHPGGVSTGIWREARRGLLRPLTAVFVRTLKSAARGAEPVVRLAAAPELEGVTGRYFDRMKEAASSARSHDAQLAARLWSASEEMVRG
jgi:retinol dehydrogenase-14